MDEEKFYHDLWRIKESEQKKGTRDWFHRIILDRVIDPFENDRVEVAAELIKCDGKILDLGIWGGKFLSQTSILERFPERFGLDLVLESVEKAKQVGIQASIWNLNQFPYPFSDKYFDAVTLLAVLEHLFDPCSVVKEVNRITKHGGQVILALPNVASFSNRIRILFGRLPSTSLDPGWDGGHLHYFTIHSVEKLLMENGFRMDRIEVSGGLRRLRRLYPSLLAGEFLVSAFKV